MPATGVTTDILLTWLQDHGSLVREYLDLDAEVAWLHNEVERNAGSGTVIQQYRVARLAVKREHLAQCVTEITAAWEKVAP